MTPPDFPTPSADSDLALVERANAGDTRAFELLVIKYQRRIERLVGRMVRDVDLVPDITQETFIRAYKALHQFRGEAQFYTWLYRIAMNTARKALLDLKRNPTVSDASLSVAGDEDDEPCMPVGAASSWHFFLLPAETQKRDGSFRPFELCYSLTFCRSL